MSSYPPPIAFLLTVNSQEFAFLSPLKLSILKKDVMFLSDYTWIRVFESVTQNFSLNFSPVSMHRTFLSNVLLIDV